MPKRISCSMTSSMYDSRSYLDSSRKSILSSFNSNQLPNNITQHKSTLSTTPNTWITINHLTSSPTTNQTIDHNSHIKHNAQSTLMPNHATWQPIQTKATQDTLAGRIQARSWIVHRQHHQAADPLKHPDHNHDSKTAYTWILIQHHAHQLDRLWDYHKKIASEPPSHNHQDQGKLLRTHLAGKKKKTCDLDHRSLPARPRTSTHFEITKPCC